MTLHSIIIIIIDISYFFNSRLLATTSADCTAVIWKTADFSKLTELKDNSQRWVWDCAFSGDSQYIITGKAVSLSTSLLCFPLYLQDLLLGLEHFIFLLCLYISSSLFFCGLLLALIFCRVYILLLYGLIF